VERPTSSRAAAEGVNPRVRTSSRIRARVLGLTPGRPFSARLTVPTETFAKRAISRMVKCSFLAIVIVYAKPSPLPPALPSSTLSPRVGFW